jgi:2-polyprenyl-3-methyl-5-hydroxy-6-metoxy-1,4-benzoquinol methylase
MAEYSENSNASSKNGTISFSFGENWKSYIGSMPKDAIERAMADHRKWMEDSEVAEKSVLDIGCGSGIHSLIFQLRGAAKVVSVDLDPKSIEATKIIWRSGGSPKSWRAYQASILAYHEAFREKYDIVYSWGVIHHTGEMWKALENACSLCSDDGAVWISLYAKGPKYQRDLALKRRYNVRGALGKWIMERLWIAKIMIHRARARKNPFAWNEKKDRGMDTWHDVIDWLGGLPYEVAGIDEVVEFMHAQGFFVRKIAPAPEGSCHVFLFRRFP